MLDPRLLSHTTYHDVARNICPALSAGQLKTNKAATLYAHPDGAYCVSLASSPDGASVCSGHMDGSIWVFNFDDGRAAGISHSPRHMTSISLKRRGFNLGIDYVAGNMCQAMVHDACG
jgi:hypothetical protein